MLVKLGMNHYYERLIYGYTTNINPRGKTIENRLRIRKDRLKKFVEAKGDYRLLCLYQLEKRYGAKWTDEELEIVEKLRDRHFSNSWQIPLRYASPTRVKNYMIKQKMWINDSFQARTKMRREGIQSTYFDYLHMKVSQGYEMNDVNLFPKDIRRRHDEMVLETEKAEIEKRNKEVLGKFPKIKSKYKKLSEKYSAAAGGLIIRPAKDAAEIVAEGRILHHCVGGDNYLHKHNTGKSTILFLRKAKEKDIPYITVEIKDEEVLQWYGKYDKKPEEKMIDAWLKTYTKELTKRKKVKSCTGTTKRRTA